jgi:SAM-dependent methyltransferase
MKLAEILPLLRCPITGDLLISEESHLRSSTGVCTFPLLEGVPLLLRDPASVRLMPRDHISNLLCEKAEDFLQTVDGPILNLSAGGSASKAPNVIEVEFAVFRNTDIVADAHALPFRDGVFSACLCMNALEHYRQPSQVLSEIYRVLKPGGELFLHTAGLQPLHEPPHHYFNVTRFGLEEWLQNFEILNLGVSPNFNPIYSLSWLAFNLERAFTSIDSAHREAFRSLLIGEVADFWGRPDIRGNPQWAMFRALPIESQEECAAGWEAKVRKPPSGSRREL